MEGALDGRGWVWRGRGSGAEVVFVGKGDDCTAEELLKRLQPDRKLAYLEQIHSAVTHPGAPGNCGKGDGIFTARQDLALAVVTADCVPVLLAAGDRIAAAHAGWRGIAAGVVGETLRGLGAPRRRVQAWIGPAIGPCCYEVGEDVASQVAGAPGIPSAASSRASVIHRKSGRERPFLDLQEAVALQLASAGVQRVQKIFRCTKCAVEDLWSYRREGPGRGRNRAFVWLESPKSAGNLQPPGGA